MVDSTCAPGQMHCTIEWDGEESSLSAVIVKDLMSSNGTYVRVYLSISTLVAHSALDKWQEDS